MLKSSQDLSCERVHENINFSNNTILLFFTCSDVNDELLSRLDNLELPVTKLEEAYKSLLEPRHNNANLAKTFINSHHNDKLEIDGFTITWTTQSLMYINESPPQRIFSSPEKAQPVLNTLIQMEVAIHLKQSMKLFMPA